MQNSSSRTTPNPYRGVYPERSRRGGAWGYITDPSGMLQLGARFYWPEVGRFVQRDPVASGPNRYTYVANMPATEVDPSGLYRPNEACRKAIRDARKAQQRMEHEFKRMREYLSNLASPIVQGPSTGIELCAAGRKSRPSKTPYELYKGHVKEINHRRNTLEDALARIARHCKDRDKQEFGAEIGKFREWMAKPVPHFLQFAPYWRWQLPVIPSPVVPGAPAPFPAPSPGLPIPCPA